MNFTGRRPYGPRAWRETEPLIDRAHSRAIALPLCMAILLGSLVFSPCVSALATDPTPSQSAAGESSENVAGEEQFRQHVAPILEQHCLACHQGIAARGGLSLATRELALQGGDSGPVLVPGKPEESLLWQMVSGQPPEMPRDSEPLSAADIEQLRQWLAAGAPWPADQTLHPAGQARWWSLRPLAKVTPPPGNDPWIKTPVDAFILQGLRAAGLSPAPPADRRTLIRRLTFDLHGLAPTPDEIETFLADESPEAYERLVDRLLASPRYGERWARHWLDVVHFGETHGYDKDKRREHAWPYRDYVIAALNADKPYGRFLTEQIAGDVLWPENPQAVIATGLIAAGPWDFVGHAELAEGTVEKAKTRAIDRDDMLATVMASATSLTIHCARCHDHPFDPITQTDYYRLASVFAGVDRGDREIPQPPDAAENLPRLVYAVRPVAPRTIQVLHRGNVESPGDAVVPGALAAVTELPAEFSLADPNQEGARRAALAQWLVDPRHPLTWRSIVNRAWHYHFGRGLVDTPSDLGRNGSLPSHPELLDWLAGWLLSERQSLKALHRLLVTSSVYQQSAADNPTALAIDADNRLLWHLARRRLEAEEIRDAVLEASGKLDLTMGGPSFPLFDFEDDHSPRYKYVARDEPATWRRTIYRFIVRSVPDPFLETLDCAEPSTLTPVRQTTITALQALSLWNNPFMLRQAEHFADRLRAESPERPAQIERMFAHALGRPPAEAERRALEQFADQHGLAAACRVLLNTSEFLFVD